MHRSKPISIWSTTKRIMCFFCGHTNPDPSIFTTFQTLISEYCRNAVWKASTLHPKDTYKKISFCLTYTKRYIRISSYWTNVLGDWIRIIHVCATCWMRTALTWKQNHFQQNYCICLGETWWTSSHEKTSISFSIKPIWFFNHHMFVGTNYSWIPKQTKSNMVLWSNGKKANLLEDRYGKD